MASPPSRADVLDGKTPPARLCTRAGIFSGFGQDPRQAGLKKIPQAGEFNDLLRRQDCGDQLTLGSGVNLIQVLLRNGLDRELPYAFVKCALSNGVGTSAADALLIQ